MKKIYAVLALSLAVGGSAFALEETLKPEQEVVAETFATGESRVARLRAGYENGEFNSLLSSLEEEYSGLQKSGRVEEFAEMRRVIEADAELKALASQFDKMAEKLLQERNAELSALCQGRDQEIATRRVKSIIAPVDELQKEAMRTLSSLRFKTPDQAGSQDEKTLIEIDLAYEFKSVQLNLQQEEGSTLLEKQIVLGMDKMRKMVQASESFTDSKLKKTVSLAAAGFDAWQVKNLDMKDLLAASKKPSSDLDRSIGSVLGGYKAKKDDLYQNEFLAKLVGLNKNS